MRSYILIALIIALVTLGCSGGGGSPASPDTARESATPQNIHSLWGFWQGVIDPDAQTVEFIPLRMTEFHLNVLPFLEPPPLLFLTLESLEFDGDLIEAGIGLRHPFLGLTEFTGFDVCGIFISNGSISGFTDSDLVMAGEGDTRLLNADGYSRWWNPVDFPMDGTVFSYTDGLLGAPDSFADYNSTVNAYKYFCDDLDDPDDPLDDVTLANRGMFSPGQKNVRHYTIHIGGGLIFNYAIDACWQFPEGDPPFSAPDDFAPEANRSEAWNISITEISNTLYNDGTESGGALSLNVDVYDWQDAGLNTMRVESPGNFAMVESSTPVGGGTGYSTYEIEITSATPDPNEIDLLISVISEQEDFEGFINGVNTTAYFMYTVQVASSHVITVELDQIKYIFDTSLGEFSPCIAVKPSGDVFIGHWRYYVEDPPNSHSTYAYSTNSGQDWIDPNWNMVSTTAVVKPNTMAIDAAGDAYFLSSRIVPSSWAGISKCISGDPSNDFGFNIVDSVHGNALIFTHDGYPVGFGDVNDHINYKKGDTANSPCTGGSWTGWFSVPEQNAVPSPARLSQTHNIERDSSNAIHLVYFSSNAADTWIRLAYNSDGTATNWNYDNDVYNGSPDGYDRARDPALHIDGNGVFHAAFILHKSSPSDAECITYARSNDGLSWDNPVTAYEASGTGVLNNVTVAMVEVEDIDVIVVTFLLNDEVHLTYSCNKGQNWEEPILLGTGNNSNPDMCTDDDGFVHNVWEHDEGDDTRIEYIRAYFVKG